MSTDAEPTGISDLLHVLEHPLWEGDDEEFARYVQSEMGVPPSFTRAAITGRAASGRSAVTIGNSGGAIVFVLAADNATQKLKITPVVAGPIYRDADIYARAASSSADTNGTAVAHLMMRHLSADLVKSLLLGQYH